jgi:hypothetical protein
MNGNQDPYRTQTTACDMCGATVTSERLTRYCSLQARVHNSVDLANSLVGGQVVWEGFQKHVGEDELRSAMAALAIIIETLFNQPKT